MKLRHGVIIGVGVILLLLGLAMPATTTTTSTTCINSDYEYADSCVEARYETPNTARGPVIGFGLILIIGGGVLANRSGTPPSTNSNMTETTTDSAGRQVPADSTNQTQAGTTTLAERVDEETNPETQSKTDGFQCPNCGEKNNSGASYCQNCGTQLR